MFWKHVLLTSLLIRWALPQGHRSEGKRRAWAVSRSDLTAGESRGINIKRGVLSMSVRFLEATCGMGGWRKWKSLNRTCLLLR
jgi:hypothetical protein